MMYSWRLRPGTGAYVRPYSGVVPVPALLNEVAVQSTASFRYVPYLSSLSSIGSLHGYAVGLDRVLEPNWNCLRQLKLERMTDALNDYRFN